MGREKTLADVETGDTVYVCNARVREAEQVIWSEARVRGVSRSGLIMVGYREFKSTGVEACPIHPFPARISLPTPEIVAEVERFNLWCEVRRLVDSPHEWDADRLRKAAASIRRIKAR